MKEVSVNPNDRIFSYQRQIAEGVASGQLREAPLDLAHTFLPGIYIRTLVVPKGATVTGLVHLHAHASFVVGDISVTTKDGEQRLTGAHMVFATAGTKRAVYAHETTIWRTVHPNPTEERDIAKLEAALVIQETIDSILNYKPMGALQ